MFKTSVLVFLAVLSTGFGFAIYPKFHPNADWRIVGGTNATEGQFPWQISLQYYGNHNCGGSIIGKKWILTAAHCVDGFPIDSLTVVVGCLLLSQGGTSYNISRAIVHEDWDTFNIKNDLALLELEEELEFNEYVQPIELEKKFIYGSRNCIVSGWGRLYTWGPLPDALQYIELTTLCLEDCQTRWEPYEVRKSEICTLTQAGEGVCNGDSGSALVLDGKQIGIVSWGNACANGIPDVYTRISYFIKWICKNIHN